MQSADGGQYKSQRDSVLEESYYKMKAAWIPEQPGVQTAIVCPPSQRMGGVLLEQATPVPEPQQVAITGLIIPAKTVFILLTDFVRIGAIVSRPILQLVLELKTILSLIPHLIAVSGQSSREQLRQIA